MDLENLKNRLERVEQEIPTIRRELDNRRTVLVREMALAARAASDEELAQRARGVTLGELYSALRATYGTGGLPYELRDVPVAAVVFMVH